MSKTDALKEKALPYLLEGDVIIDIYQLHEDFIAFLQNRVLAVNKEILSSKREVTSVPYSKISAAGYINKGFFSGSTISIYMGSKRIEVECLDKQLSIEIYKKLTKISLGEYPMPE